MNWLRNLITAIKREHNRRKRWKNRTAYTWMRNLPPPSSDTDRKRNVGSWT